MSKGYPIVGLCAYRPTDRYGKLSWPHQLNHRHSHVQSNRQHRFYSVPCQTDFGHPRPRQPVDKTRSPSRNSLSKNFNYFTIHCQPSRTHHQPEHLNKDWQITVLSFRFYKIFPILCPPSFTCSSTVSTGNILSSVLSCSSFMLHEWTTYRVTVSIIHQIDTYSDDVGSGSILWKASILRREITQNFACARYQLDDVARINTELPDD